MTIVEPISEEVDFSLDDINLQEIIMDCNSQRPRTIPPDQLQRIEWALQSEFSCPPPPTVATHNQGILTTTNLGSSSSLKDNK